MYSQNEASTAILDQRLFHNALNESIFIKDHNQTVFNNKKTK